MRPEDCTTRADCDNAIATFKQRRRDLEGGREFRFEDAYCVGGADHPYTMAEPDAMAHLRSELINGGADPVTVGSASWEDLAATGIRFDGEGDFSILKNSKLPVYRFDVTRDGCQPSSLFVSLLT